MFFRSLKSSWAGKQCLRKHQQIKIKWLCSVISRTETNLFSIKTCRGNCPRNSWNWVNVVLAVVVNMLIFSHLYSDCFPCFEYSNLSLEILKEGGQPRPLFHLFLSFCTENLSCQQESNSDRWSIRRGRWPLDHHHVPV